MAYETDSWPMIEARWFGPRRDTTPRLIVIHTIECPFSNTAASSCGHDFATRLETEKASSHVGVDTEHIIQYVKDSFVAFAAPGANHDGMQIELAGHASFTAQDWRTPQGNAVLVNGADVMAQYALKYNIPLLHISNDALAKGARGVIGHYQASAVYKKSDHPDPGSNFPWTRFIGYGKAAFFERQAA